ncbi:MAG: FoF1 ATP synthase subunit a [Candidatus Limnocylindrales bacterium]
MTSATPAVEPRGMSRRNYILLLLGILILIDVVAIFVAPPFDPKAADCTYPVCFINGNLELPAPHVIWALEPQAASLITFQVSITSTIVTMWIVSVFVIALLFLLTRGREMLPGKAQNAIEHVYELIEGFGTSLGGPAAKPFIPLFAAFFLYILFSNWSGLIPPIGKIEALRAPTSDVNITIGLALVAFLFFQYQGFKALGVGGYLSKFFPFKEFRNGIGAGIIALFVGLVELLLEFVKPVTLSMRLFGNIYGGEVALGVMTALTVAIIPMALIALELMLNLVQALIFSTLMLMFTLAAMEGHGDEHHQKQAHDYEPTATPVDPDIIVGAH